MTDNRQVYREDLLMLLGRTSPSGVSQCLYGLAGGRPAPIPQRWLSTVRSGLKEFWASARGVKRALPPLLKRPRPKSKRFLWRRDIAVWFTSVRLHPDWVYWRSLQMDLPDFFRLRLRPASAASDGRGRRRAGARVAVISPERTRILTWCAGLPAGGGRDSAQRRTEPRRDRRTPDHTRRRPGDGPHRRARKSRGGPDTTPTRRTGPAPDRNRRRPALGALAPDRTGRVHGDRGGQPSRIPGAAC